MDDAAAQDVDALAQQYADQQVFQSLLAERQALQTLQPGQSGWGAAQRRLRAIAPEIARLQAMCATQTAEPIATEPAALSSAALSPKDSRSASEDLPLLSMSGPSSPTNEDAAELAARRLRLLALQQELAQLKRTPSMQLLAR